MIVLADGDAVALRRTKPQDAFLELVRHTYPDRDGAGGARSRGTCERSLD
jgi:hypothetical protein